MMPGHIETLPMLALTYPEQQSSFSLGQRKEEGELSRPMSAVTTRSGPILPYLALPPLLPTRVADMSLHREMSQLTLFILSLRPTPALLTPPI